MKVRDIMTSPVITVSINDTARDALKVMTVSYTHLTLPTKRIV